MPDTDAAIDPIDPGDSATDRPHGRDPRALPVLPLSAGVVLPEMVVTVALESDEARAAAEAATADELALVPRREGKYAKVGTIARIEHRGALRNGTPALTIRATERAVLGTGVIGAGEALWVEATPVTPKTGPRTDELARRYRATATAVLDALGANRGAFSLGDLDDPSALADTVSYLPDLTLEQRIELLETIDVDARLERAIGWAETALAEIELAKTIRDDVTTGMEADQREALLRRQLAAIQRELGDGSGDAVAELRARLAQVHDSLPSAAAEAIAKEIDRLERTGAQSQEGTWIRTWLDTVFELPYGVTTDDHLDLVAARAVLDADHTGLDDVKDRIVEHLAVRKLRIERDVDRDSDRDGAQGDEPEAQGDEPGAQRAQRAPRSSRRGGVAILALVGPPGVGKTSLGESIAGALGRKFVRMALGGIRDEAEIRGHRRTYVGARPGRIVRALAEAGTMNPVLLLDEIDKLGADWRGDPSSALLEVLDPAQNHSFRDHYLEFELDLSDVLFIATANRLDTIPAPLLDRVEVIELNGYSDDEKTVIAQRHILGRLRAEMGLHEHEVVVAPDAIAAIAADWTAEAGVRGLERKLATVLRKAATRIASDPNETAVHVEVDDLRALLGAPIMRETAQDRTAIPGVATGLAVTGAGGEVLFVEATAMPGDAGLTLTGQLGDVMRESGEIAWSYLRAHTEELGLEIEHPRIHLHVPAGAVPKDGPSAGVAMTTALASLASGRPVRADVGMTGEVTLAGRVLPIGGVKQKLLAAHRAGLTTVILPSRNEHDLEDVPEAVRDALTIHLVSDVTEVLDVALEASPRAALTSSP